MTELPERLSEADATPCLWAYKGVCYVTNLFRIHDEMGFPLSESAIQCKMRGWVPCYLQFRMDAILAGWTRQRIDAVIEEAKREEMLWT